jgi:hypothetical protein
VLDAISLPPLNVARVVAGRSALAYRNVRWIQVMNWPADEFIRPGDLVLSTAVAPSAEQSRDFLVSVASSDAAALIVSLPPGIDPTVVDAATAVAQDREFPLLRLPWEVPFADVTRTVTTQLLAAGCHAEESACALRHAGIRFRDVEPNVTDELARAMARRTESADVEVALGRPVQNPSTQPSFTRMVDELAHLADRERLQLRICRRPEVALLVLERAGNRTTLRDLIARARDATGDNTTHWVIADRNAQGGASEPAQSLQLGRQILRERGGWVASQSLESLFVLGAMAQSPLIAPVVTDAVGPLVEYDRQHRRNLVETLEVFLDESCNTSAAARRLFLNRHSLMYRLDKIEQLTGFSLKEPADRFFLHASARLYRYRLLDGMASD